MISIFGKFSTTMNRPHDGSPGRKPEGFPMRLPTMPTPSSQVLCEARAAVFKALGHPARLRLVETLAAGPVCVCELAELLPQGLPAVSKHLALLREAGIVQARREGQKIFYRLTMPCLLESFGCVDRLLLRRGEALAAAGRELAGSPA
jgi:DNA-binding transcriptional ArsR family regulator